MCRKWIYLACLPVLLGLPQASVAHAADSHLVGWWKLDETSGLLAHDSSGYGNHGTLHGDPEWTGHGLEFDGEGDYVDCRDGPSLNIAGSVTITAWIRLDGPADDRKIAGNQDGITGGYKFGLYGNQVEFEIRTADNVAVLNRSVAGGIVLEPGMYHHVAGVYSEGQYIRTYVDGVLDRELSTAELLGASTETFKLGREPFSDSYYWLGLMADVRVYNRALTSAEIQAMPMQARNPDPPDGAVIVGSVPLFSWEPGEGATGHNVYFGASPDLTDADMLGVVYVPMYFHLPGLEPGTYYWRTDAVFADGTVVPGDVWSFTTVANRYMQMEVVEVDASITSVELPLDGGPESGPITVSLAADREMHQAGFVDFPSKGGLIYWPIEISFPLLDELGRGPIETTLVGPFRLDPDDYSRFYVFDIGYVDHPDLGQILCCNNNKNSKRFDIFEVADRGGTIGGEFVDMTAERFAVAEAPWLRSAMDTALAEVRALNPGMPHIAPRVLDEAFAIYQDDPSIEIVLYFLDSGEFRTGHLSGTDAFELSVPDTAWRASPAAGMTHVDTAPTLTWLSGASATLHDVYFGTKEAAVIEATYDSPEYRGAQDATSYSPEPLEHGVTYYWRIDEIQPDGAVLRGATWSFTTGPITIGDLKRPGREQYVGRTVAIEGIFVRDPLPMLVTDLDVVLANMPMQEDQYILLVGGVAEEIDPQEFGGAKVSLTAVVLDPNDPLGLAEDGLTLEVVAIELIEMFKLYYPIEPVIPDWIPVLPQPDKYAILFSGGVNAANNHGRYWNDLKFMYKTLVNTYGYPPEQIAVLYADGNPEDSDMPVHYPGTQADLETVFELLKGVTDVFDTVFLFTTNHGGGFWKNDPYGYYVWGGQLDTNGDEPATDVIKEADYGLDLNGDGDTLDQVSWDDELCGWADSVFDDAFPNIFSGLTYGKMIIVMEQCFSAGPIWDMAGSNRVIMSAAGEYEPSWAMPPSYTYDEFSYHFTCAVNGATPSGTPVNADANADGKVSMLEAFNYARAHDTQPETPHYEDNGDGVPHTGPMPAGGDGTLGSNTFL